MQGADNDEARSLRAWATITRVLMFVYIASAAFVIGALALTFFAAPSRMIGALIGVTMIVTFASWLASIVSVCIWVYLAHDNLRARGLAELRFSPGWAAGSFFVPVLNFVVPFQAMRDLYNRSIGEPAHLAHESAPDVTSWWTCTIVGGLIQQSLIAMILFEALTPAYFTTPVAANILLALFGALLLMGSAFFLQRIIATVTRGQLSGVGVHETFA